MLALPGTLADELATQLALQLAQVLVVVAGAPAAWMAHDLGECAHNLGECAHDLGECAHDLGEYARACVSVAPAAWMAHDLGECARKLRECVACPFARNQCTAPHRRPPSRCVAPCVPQHGAVPLTPAPPHTAAAAGSQQTISLRHGVKVGAGRE